MDVPSVKPFFSEEDTRAISEEIMTILRSGRLILGPYTRQFEDNFSDYIGVKHAIGVSSCTAALEICLQYFDVKDKEVIVPTNTFIATSNAVLFSGGKPVLADIKPETLCLDPEEIVKRITPATKGVIIVHVAGLPCPDVDEIKSICRERHLFLLEDTAHSHGAAINGKKTGSLVDAGCFSFYATKVMTTCTGGMITTDNDQLAEFAYSLRHYGVGKGLNNIVNLGNDWLMDEISALLGIYQLKALDSNLAKRNEIASKYNKAFSHMDWPRPFSFSGNIRHSYYKYPVLLSPGVNKQELIALMHDEFEVDLGSIYDPPCHLQPVYRRLFGYHEGMFPQAEETLSRTFCLPIFPQMVDAEIDYTIQSLNKTLARFRYSEIQG